MSNSKLVEKFNSLTLESEDRWDYRGKSNSERDFVHGFCTYPAMMVPKMQREMLEVCLKEMSKKRLQLLDPFAGSGTMLVEGMLKGLDVTGIDINPLAVLLCKVKTTIIDIGVLETAEKSLICRISSLDGVLQHSFAGIDKWFTQKAILELSRIRKAIKDEPLLELRRFFWATFCEVVRIVSNSRDCTYKLHIKEQADIDAYNKDAIELFKETLRYNINQYKEFYQTLQQRGLIKKSGCSYKGNVSVILGDTVSYLKHSKKKFDLIFTSPPYGDNHTTVSYGQYSVMPLRWIECKDIDNTIDEHLLDTLFEIDNVSLGGKSAEKYITRAKKKVVNKSKTLDQQVKEIAVSAPKQVNKLIAFYGDYDEFLSAISKKMKPNAISVWTLGNRKVAKQEIFMNKIMIELGKNYKMILLTSFTRKILKKRMPELNAHKGEEKGLQSTMTREHILIFVKGGSENE